MANINISNIFNTKVNNNANEKNKQFLKAGDVLSATIENRTDEYLTLKGENGSLKVPSKSVVGEVGDEVSFEVTGVNDGKVALKQLNVKNQNEVTKSLMKQQDSDEILELFKQSNFIVEEDVLETDQKALDEKRAKEIIRKIQNEILFASGSASDSAISELLSNNISVTDVTVGVLSKISNEIDKRPFDKISDEEINEITDKYLKENNISAEGFEEKAEIIKSLKENGLNVNSNVTQIESAIAKFNDAVKKGNFEGLILDENISIEEIVENAYSQKSAVADEVVQNEDLYKKLSEKLGLEFNEETKDTFNKFLAKDIAINEENIKKLEDIKNELSSITKEELIDKIVNALAKGDKAQEATIIGSEQNLGIPDISLIDKNLATKDALANVKIENIANLLINNERVTIGDIKNAVINNDVAEVVSSIADEAQNQYKNLLTIMQKMTYESAYSLAKSGIDIDTKTVTEVLQAINSIDTTKYKIALATEEVPQNAENVETMKTFFDKISNTALINNNYRQLDGVKVIDNITEYANLFSNSSNAYEIFETKATSKWNDTIRDYKSQIANILNELGLEATDENIEATEILIRSKIDISEKAIIDVKDLNLKIDKVMDTLHPKIVANMLKDNVNPLDLNIDEIIEVIDSYENEFGENITDKLARNIINLQKDSEVSEETVAAVKAFYKALNSVVKNDKASLARTIDAGHEYTVKNLLDTAKYFEKTKANNSMINEAIGDEYIERTITENIESVINNALEKTSYEKNLLEKISRNVENEPIIDMIENGDFENTLLETIAKGLEEFNQKTYNREVNESDVNAFVDKLNNALSQSSLSLEMLLNSNAKINLKNLGAIKELVDNPQDFKAKLEELVADNEELSEMFSEVTKEDLTSLSGVGSVIDIQIGEIENYMPTNEQTLVQKTEILNSFNLMNLFNKNENSPYSQMAIKLPHSDELTTLNMYVIDENFESKQTKTIALSLAMENLGNINATIKISGDSADINIKGDNKGISYLQQNEEEIKALFNENDMDVMLSFETK